MLKRTTEEDLLYEALKSSLGLVVKADPVRLRKAKAKLTKTDPAVLELSILGPDRGGLSYIVRAYKTREVP